MKSLSGLIAAGLVAVSLAPAPAAAASLLGGLITTGADSHNGSGLVSSNSNGSVGVGGSNGAAVNLGGLTGGSGSGGLLGGGSSLGSGSAGVPGVAEVSTGSSGGGTTLGTTLLGGGGNTLTLNPLGLLGDNGGANITLPGLGGLAGGPSSPGEPGAPGINGGPGFNAPNGYPGVGSGSGSFYIGPNVSSRLRAILAMLAERNWIRLVDGRAICLGNFGTAEVSSVLPRKDWAGLNAALPRYAQDIATLRQMLANCRSPQKQQALDVRDLNRVIGVDIGQGGRPVVYLL